MRGMGRLWQAAGTVQSILRPGLIDKAAEAGLRSLFVGFETLDPKNLRASLKYQNLNRDYNAAIRRLHDLGVMVNASFVFGKVLVLISVVIQGEAIISHTFHVIIHHR